MAIFIGSIIIIILIFIFYMTFDDKMIQDNIKKDIIKNTEISLVEYLNKYDNYYIVMDNNSLYVIDSSYKVVLEIEKFLLHQNTDNYQIIYKDDKIMYFCDKYEDGKLIYEYYDIYKYELIDKIIIGGE